MSHSASSTPSLTPSRSASPEAPVQPDHFYGNDNASAVSSPHGKPWLDPADDPLAQRGIPVFKPTMVEFQDFERYMNRIECWGMRSGIVKVIPPKEWTDALPSVIPQLGDVKLKSPIEQHMIGHGGLFRQQNIEKRKIFSVREWAEMCATDDLRAPGKDEIELRSGAGAPAKRKPRRVPKKAKDGVVDEQGLAGVVMVKDEPEVDDGVHVAMDVDEGISVEAEGVLHVAPSTDNKSPAATILTADASDNNHAHQPSSTQVPVDENNADAEQLQGAEGGSSRKKGRAKQTGATKEAQLAERAAKDATFLQDFKPLDDWLPPKTTNADYTPDFCKELERRYWRNCGLGKAPWYGADLLGSLFTDDTKAWNVAHLPSTLSRLLPASSKGLPGVNTPYLYFGMWRATFAWHVEDMDLFSINYIHFGAPKFWYAMPQARSGALEQTMKGYFPRDIMECPQFLRHKSFLASPTVLGQSSCRPNTLVQRQGEFVITYPKGYHAGFNLGFNCAESVNFALDSWLDLGRKAKICTCVNYSVRIDVDQLLADREAERLEAEVKPKAEIELLDASNGRKRKAGDAEEIEETNVEQSEQPSKKLKIRISKPVSNEGADVATPAAVPVGTAFPSKPKVLLKLGPQPKAPEVEAFPCCLCVSTRRDGLLRVINPPFGRKEGASGSGKSEPWMAHEECASVVPETWVDEIDIGVNPHTGALVRERVVLGVDAIVKDRWNLKCSACSKTRQKAHGAPVQCTKGRCPRAFHVSCARDGAATNIVYNVLGFTEKEVISVDQAPPANGIPAQYHQTAQPPPPMASLQPPVPMPGQQSFHAPTPQLTAGPSHIEPNPSAQYQSQSPVKVVRKLEVSVLCPQHNPAISDAKKAQKQDKIKAALLALPPMARIKLRVSAGVFEVTLVSVMEETGCVEVLWDRGLKREFRWGSVVFGKTEDVVGHKPAEPATGPDANRPGPPMPKMKSLTPAAVDQYQMQNRTHSSGGFAPLPTSVGTIEIRQAQLQQSSHPPPASHAPIQNVITPDKNHGIMPYHIPEPHQQPQAPAKKRSASKAKSKTPAPVAVSAPGPAPVAGPSKQPAAPPPQPQPQPQAYQATPPPLPQHHPHPQTYPPQHAAPPYYPPPQSHVPYYPPPPHAHTQQQPYPSYHWNYHQHPQYANPYPYYPPPMASQQPQPPQQQQQAYYALPPGQEGFPVSQQVSVPTGGSVQSQQQRQVSRGLQWQTPYTGPRGAGPQS